MAFRKDFNTQTQKYKPNTLMAVTITAFKDNTFEFTVKSPSVTWYLKKAVGLVSGSSWPSHVIATTLSVRHIYEIAKVKQSDPYCQYMSLESICKSIIGRLIQWGLRWSMSLISLFISRTCNGLFHTLVTAFVLHRVRNIVYVGSCFIVFETFNIYNIISKNSLDNGMSN
ncbi:Large ribosomal subunit protein uL11 [Theobroma cacao]|nr:Large ribosomal subunit protein uL11 [Theobroma cacao]